MKSDSSGFVIGISFPSPIPGSVTLLLYTDLSVQIRPMFWVEFSTIFAQLPFVSASTIDVSANAAAGSASSPAPKKDAILSPVSLKKPTALSIKPGSSSDEVWLVLSFAYTCPALPGAIPSTIEAISRNASIEARNLCFFVFLIVLSPSFLFGS